ncbi:triple QxxK/R motif-containing protein isoform X2 [Myotis yumanensis]
MGRKDASTVKLPVDQYRKQIGKQDYKKTKPILRATKLKAEAKKTAIGIKVPDSQAARSPAAFHGWMFHGPRVLALVLRAVGPTRALGLCLLSGELPPHSRPVPMEAGSAPHNLVLATRLQELNLLSSA